MSDPVDRPGVLLDPGQLMLILRAALGVIFVMGGVKLAFPSDAQALAASYWIPPPAGFLPSSSNRSRTASSSVSLLSFAFRGGWRSFSALS